VTSDITLSVDGRVAATDRLLGDLQTYMFSAETFDVGSDTGSDVSPDYSGPATFEGRILTVRVAVPTPVREGSR